MTDASSHLDEVAGVAPSRHATAHLTNERHPLIQSDEPAEDRRFCYDDGIAFLVDEAPSFEHL
ncbi:MAG: hypothetical protein QOG64_2455 [Acidimicrobiaceae bacterium]|nr:hypothetical protein [Acidimicrobiaceae bacterium]